MKKITIILTFLWLFLIFENRVFAAYNFDYFFGTLFAPVTSINQTVSSSSAAPVSSAPAQALIPTQISSIQARLNEMKLTLANLNSSLVKSNSNITNTLKGSSKVAITTTGIPLLLKDEAKKQENQVSVFASLIPPDIRNSPLIATHLIVLTLGLLGIIIYLIFIRRQENKQLKRFT